MSETKRRQRSPTLPRIRPMTAEELWTMAENCEAAARRLAATGNESDTADAVALETAGAIHRTNAEAADAAERPAERATYWWHDRED